MSTDRARYEALLDPTTAPPEDQPLARLAAALRAGLQERQQGLAWAEWLDGAWVSEDQAGEEEDDLRLAASDVTALDYPVTYAGAGWTIVVGLDEDAVPYVVLEAGPATQAVVAGLTLHLEPGEEISLPDLLAPPSHVVVLDGPRRVRLEP